VRCSKTLPTDLLRTGEAERRLRVFADKIRAERERFIQGGVALTLRATGEVKDEMAHDRKNLIYCVNGVDKILEHTAELRRRDAERDKEVAQLGQASAAAEERAEHAEERARLADERARHAEESARHAEEIARHAEERARLAEDRARLAEERAIAAEAAKVQGEAQHERDKQTILDLQTKSDAAPAAKAKLIREVRAIMPPLSGAPLKNAVYRLLDQYEQV